MSRRMFTFMRHGQTTFNERGLVNGDPTVAVHLTDLGRQQCRLARIALAGRRFDLAVRTRFPRTGESLGIVLDGRDVPVVIYPELDDVHLGVFESGPVDAYRAWRHSHTPADPPPGEGESRIDVLYRYMRGFERMMGEDADAILSVLHDVPIRFLLNGAQDADPLDGPVRAVHNAEVHTLDELQMDRALTAFGDRLGM